MLDTFLSEFDARPVESKVETQKLYRRVGEPYPGLLRTYLDKSSAISVYCWLSQLLCLLLVLINCACRKCRSVACQEPKGTLGLQLRYISFQK